MPAKRAPRIAAPGGERLTLTGIVAASDTYGRARLMILDESPDGRPDPSAVRLRRCCPPSEPAATSAPYDLREEPILPPNADGVRGICRIVIPQTHKKYWTEQVAALRGRWVRAEVLVRRFAFEAPDGERRAGVALDLAMLAEPAPTSGPASAADKR